MALVHNCLMNEHLKKPKDIQIIANFMDKKFKAPGGIRFGFDSILGLIPGVGDIIGSIISFYILGRGYMMGCSPTVLKEMFINILIDQGVGSVPIIGDVFDVFWKANSRNVNLLNSHLDGPIKERKSSKKVLILLVSVLILFISISLMLTYYFLKLFFSLI